jgi:hypothetical protein
MGLARLRERASHPIEIFAVISEEEMIHLCDKYNIRWTFYENEPLGAKKNHGLTEAMKLEWDYLIEVGSDDIIKDELLVLYNKYFGEYEMFGTKDSVIINSEDGMCRRLVSDTPYGLGRCISRKVIQDHCFGYDILAKEGMMAQGRTVGKGNIGFFKPDQAHEAVKLGRAEIVGEPRYKLWRDDINRGLDNSSNYFLLTVGVGYKTVETERPLTIDIKGSENIWPFSEKIGVKYDLAKTLEGLSQEEQSAIVALWKRKNKEVIEYANNL